MSGKSKVLFMGCLGFERHAEERTGSGIYLKFPVLYLKSNWKIKIKIHGGVLSLFKCFCSAFDLVKTFGYFVRIGRRKLINRAESRLGEKIFCFLINPFFYCLVSPLSFLLYYFLSFEIAPILKQLSVKLLQKNDAKTRRIFV